MLMGGIDHIIKYTPSCLGIRYIQLSGACGYGYSSYSMCISQNNGWHYVRLQSVKQDLLHNTQSLQAYPVNGTKVT